ncbi:MAG: hypothetical protein KC457_36415, partial [Myxococcales bacterium]|nr:hypothetical protein [Myxococcales bacterium]
LWDLATCRERETVTLYDAGTLLPGEGVPVDFADDGTLVVHRRGDILLVHRDGRRTRIEDGCQVHDPRGAAMLSGDGRRLLSWCSSADGDDMQVWDLVDNRLISSFVDNGYSFAPVFTADGRSLIFVAGRRELVVVDTDTGRETLRIPTVDIDATYTSLGLGDGGEVEVLTTAGDLVRYPVTHAGLVEAACELLLRDGELR